MAEATDIGSLTLSLKAGESAIVETGDGDIRVQCVRQNGSHKLVIRVTAPRRHNIRREDSAD